MLKINTILYSKFKLYCMIEKNILRLLFYKKRENTKIVYRIFKIPLYILQYLLAIASQLKVLLSTIAVLDILE